MSSFIEKPRYQCALGGALTTVNAINRAVAIVHSAPGCASTADSAAKSGSGYWGAGYCDGRATPSTNIIEKEVIFGGEQRLKEQIESTFEIIDADLFTVITGCMTDIIGDDVNAVAEEFRALGKPLVVAETGGFKGNSYKGYDLILQAIVNQYVTKGLTKNPKKVNILGLVPALDPFWRGNLIEVKRLLKELGIEASTFFTHFDNLDSLKNSSEASLNIVFSDVNGIGAAKAYEEIHEIPYVNLPLPIGPDSTDEFLRFIAQKFDVENELLEKVIREEKEYYYGYIQNVADIYNDLDLQRHAIIVGNADYAYAVTKFVTNDFGWIPYFTAITDILEDEEKEKVKKVFESFNEDLKPYLVFETDTSIIASKLKEKIEEEKDSYGSPISPAFVLGSTLDRSLANELKAGFLSITYPVTNRVVTDQGYTGYRGGLRLVNDILSSLLSNR